MMLRALPLLSLLPFGLLAAGCVGAYAPPDAEAVGGDGFVPPALRVDFSVPTPRDRFGSDIKPILEVRCAACHARDNGVGPSFMKAPVYESVLAWPGFVTGEPAQSRLVTKGPHNGAVYFNDAELQRVVAWLGMEAAMLPVDDNNRPETPPQKQFPGVNIVQLGPLGSDFAGASITFDAQLLGATLELSNLTVNANGQSGLHIVHPLFLVWSGGKKTPDPVDSFAGLDLTVAKGGKARLGPGLVFLANVGALDQIAIAFEIIERSGAQPGRDGGVPAADGGVMPMPMGGCKAVALFTKAAQPGLAQRCAGCHGGQNGTATNALDMRKLMDLGPQGQAAVCDQVKIKVNVADAAKSQLFLVTAPKSAEAHPYKFNNDQNAFNAFMQSVSQWIAAEK